MEPTTGPGEPRRIDGVDVARAIAIIGMVTVHLGPTPPEETGPLALVYGSFHGKASILFVLVAGISVTIMSRGTYTRAMWARLAYRALWLVPLGLWLQTLDHNVAVILQYYGLYFVCAAPFLVARDRTLLASAATMLPLGSVAVLAAHIHRPEAAVRVGGEPPGLLSDLLLYGYYPVVTWLPPMLFGLWLGRRDLRASATRWWLVAGGTVTLVGSTWLARGLQAASDRPATERTWSWILSAEPHANMPLSVLGASGFAAAFLGMSLALADRWPRALWPLAASGRLALTIYVGHLLLLPVIPDLLTSDALEEATVIVGVFTAVSAAFAVAWLWFARRGPLESAARWPWERGLRPLVDRYLGPD